MIPKIIHYIWFGGKEYSERIKLCIKSWEKYLPEYKFMLWNEDTFDINEIPFTKQAYEHKKWAFVSDYVRVWALNKYGGIYLDTDIEILKPIDNDILKNKIVLGTDDAGYLTALMMAEPNQPFFNNMVNLYQNMDFITENGKLNTEVNNTYLQKNLTLYGYKVKNSYQKLKDDIVVFPDEFFHVRSLVTGKLNLTKNSFAIHWHTITWVSKRTKFINFLRINVLVPLLGTTLYNKLTNKIRGK